MADFNTAVQLDPARLYCRPMSCTQLADIFETNRNLMATVLRELEMAGLAIRFGRLWRISLSSMPAEWLVDENIIQLAIDRTGQVNGSDDAR